MTTIEHYYFMEGIAVAFFLIMAVQNLWTHEIRLRMILGWILLYWAMQHLISLMFTADFIVSHQWNPFYEAFEMTAEPTCCFLLVEQCRPGWLTWRKVVLHEIPFVALGLTYLFTGNALWFDVLLGFFVLYGCGTFVAILYYLPRYNRFLREQYSYEENVNLRWIYVTLVTFFILMFVYAACGASANIVGNYVYVFGSIASWSWICYCIWRQEAVLSELVATQKDEETKSEPAEGQDIDTVLADVIEARFIKPQLYLNPKLKLGDMATAIGTNRTYLSRYLNNTLHTTFYDYINNLRLEYATRLMSRGKYSVTAIASMSGFNSYSTFRRVFIAKHGFAPTEWGILN